MRSRGELEYSRDPHFYPLFWPISFVYTPANIVKGIVHAIVARDADPNWYKAAWAFYSRLSAMVKVSKSSIVLYRATLIAVPIMTDGRTDGDSLAIERSFLREEISAAVGYIEIS